MPISRLYGAAAPRFIREIKQSEYWDRAAIDTPPGPFETTRGFRLDWERRTASGNIDISSARGLSPQPVTPVFVFVQRTFWAQ